MEEKVLNKREKRNGYDAAFYCSLYRCSDFNVYRC